MRLKAKSGDVNTNIEWFLKECGYVFFCNLDKKLFQQMDPDSARRLALLFSINIKKHACKYCFETES